MNESIQPKIVVVDDSDFSRKQISEILEKNGIKVDCNFSNGATALEFIKKNRVDIAIIDIVMPEMSGIALAREIIEVSQKTLLIMVSSLTQERIVLESIDVGAHDFIRKPIQEEYLVDSVKKAIAAQRQL